MREKPIHIAYSLFHKFCGMTYEEICDGLWQFYGIIARPSTIHDWINRYGGYVADTITDQHIPLSRYMYIDEMCESIRIEDDDGKYVRTDFWWIVNAYDPVHDIWRESMVSPNRDTDLAYKMLDRIVTQFDIDKQCRRLVLVTDGLSTYLAAYDRMVNEGKINPETIRLISVPKESNDPNQEVPPNYAIVNEIETFHTFIRSLTKRKRKSKVFLSPEATQEWLDNARLHYNCIETLHNGNGTRTTRIQGILPDFNQSRNRWLGFIVQALKLRWYITSMSQNRKSRQKKNVTQPSPQKVPNSENANMKEAKVPESVKLPHRNFPNTGTIRLGQKLSSDFGTFGGPQAYTWSWIVSFRAWDLQEK